MVTVIVTMKESVLLLSNAEVRSISVSLPTSGGAIEFWILPVDRKDSFTFKLFTEDGEMAWCVNATDAAVVLRAVLVTMSGGATVTANKVIVGVGGYDGDAGCGRGRWGRRVFAITVGKVGRGRSGGTCSAAIVERDIVHKPGVISSGEAEAALSTGGGTGRGVSGEWGRRTGFLIIRSHTSWTTSRIIVLASSGIRHIARFLIRLCR